MKSRKIYKNRLLSIQGTATKAIENAEALSDVISSLLPEIARLYQWDFAAYWRVAGDGHLVCEFVHDRRGDLNELAAVTKNSEFDVGTGLPGQTYGRGSTIWMPDILKESGIPRHDLLHKCGIHTAVGVPLVFREEIIGICEFFCDQSHEPNDDFIEVISNIGIQIGQFAVQQDLLRRIAESQKRVTGIIECALDAIIEADDEGIITEWNPSAEKMFGWSAEEAVGRQMRDLIIPPEYRAAHDAGMANYLKTGKGRILNTRVELTALHKERGAFPIELTVAAQVHGKKNYFVAFMRDITERKFFEEQLSAALNEAEANRDRAEAANRTKTEFLANMSHEIRSPMNAIVGAADILSRQSPTKLQREFIDIISRSSNDLLALIDDLLDISKMEAGQNELHIAPFSFEQIIREITPVLFLKAEEKNLALKIRNTAGENFYLGDQLRLRQVIVNLCTNAIKFTDSGTVELEIQSVPEGDYDFVQLRVSDTGIGISEEQRSRIFEKFTQADSSIRRRYGGTGLGLSITKSILQSMGGKIEVMSEFGEGSTFVAELRLPLADRPAAPSPQEPGELDRAGKSARVLVVEDLEPNLLVATQFLKEFGYAYDIARNAREGIKLLEDEVYDAVLMDVQMPGMSGLEATRIIRKIENENRRPRVPIIGVTAHALAGDKDACIEAGMDDYLRKPYRSSELKEILKKIFAKTRS